MESAPDTSRDPAADPSGEIVYRQLRDRLLAGSFPLSRRLAEEQLATLVGVPQTPVRHALIRLHGEGLISRHPDGGYRPTAPDPDDISDLHEARRILEIGALWRPAEAGVRHDRAAMERLHDDWEALRRDRPIADAGFVSLDEDFHVRLAESAGNGVLIDLLRSINARIRVVRIHDFRTGDRIQRTIAEHLRLLGAVMADDPERAELILRAHLAESRQVAEERAVRALARMAALD